MFNNYNEAFTSVNSVWSSYKKFYNWYKNQNLIAPNKKIIIKFIKNTGVTCICNNENKETFIPFIYITKNYKYKKMEHYWNGPR